MLGAGGAGALGELGGGQPALRLQQLGEHVPASARQTMCSVERLEGGGHLVREAPEAQTGVDCLRVRPWTRAISRRAAA